MIKETTVRRVSKSLNSSWLQYPGQLLTREIIASAIEVHRTLGPGLLESAYQAGLGHELHLRNLDFAQQVDLPVNYKSAKLDCGYRIDLIVADRVVGELSLCKK